MEIGLKAKSVKYKTTITSIEEVLLSGEIVYDADLECYTIGGNSAEYWLERIEGEHDKPYVIVEIRVTDGRGDDSEIVNAEVTE